MEDIRAEVARWTPEEVERISGVPGAQLREVALQVSQNRPSTLIWCMGATQKSVGTANVRAFSILQLALGNIGAPGGGVEHLPRPLQRAGRDRHGPRCVLAALLLRADRGSLAAFGRVWDLDYDWLVNRFGLEGMAVEEKKALMEAKGIPTTRWFDGAQAEREAVDQPNPIRGMFVMGHGGNTVTRMPEMLDGLAALDLLVVVDAHPTTFSAVRQRQENSYILPACTQFEQDGSRVCSNRSIQWGEKVVEPIFESKNDREVLYLLASRLGFAEELCKHIQVNGNEPLAEDITREIRIAAACPPAIPALRPSG